MLAARITLLLAAVAAFTAQGALAQTNYTSVADAASKLGLTRLVDAVVAANLTNRFSDPAFQGIVLAPSNDAFAALGATPSGQDLSNVLMYHVLSELPTSGFPAVVDSGLPSSNDTNGRVTLQATQDSNVLLALGVAPGANIQLNSSVTVGNATVYIIESVLLPPSKPGFLSGFEAVNGTAELSTLLEFAARFPDIVETLQDQDLGCTVFAPNNEAFANLTASIEGGAELPDQVVRNVLLNHVVATPIVAEAVTATPTNVTTLLPNGTLTATKGGDAVTVAVPGTTVSANVVRPDIKAGKCVVHIVDKVLVPAPASESNTCWLAVVADADGPAPPVGSAQYPTITAALTARGFTTLAAALNQTNLTGAVENTTAIIFAPSDEALARANATSLPNDLLTTVLKYHVVPTTTPMAMLNATQATLTTLAEPGDNITPSITVTPVGEDQLLLSGIAPGVLLVNLTNSITAGNSRIYPITSVLRPPVVPTTVANLTIAGLAQTVQTAQNLTTLTALVLADSAVAQVASDPNTAATVFAPNDAAFEVALAQLNATGVPAPQPGSTEARVVLLTHVLGRPWTAASLPTGNNVTVPTLSGQNVTIYKNTTGVFIAGPGNTQFIQVVVPDVLAGKSVVHVINGVILPDLSIAIPSPAPAPSPAFVAPPPGGSNIGGTPTPPPAGGAATTSSASAPLMVLSALLGALMMVTMAAGSRM